MQVIDGLLKKQSNINFYLVGSKNGSTDADEIMKNFSNSKKVNNFVGKLTLIQTFEKLKESTDFILSMSKFTLPHELAYLVLIEQIYRAMSIQNGSKYHRA